MTAFHYKVKINLINFKTKDGVKFITQEKEFRNENPIVARKEAFDEYQEWVNNLYTGVGKHNGYVNDRQARIDLRGFIKQNHDIEIDNKIYNINNPFEFGIGVYFVIDEPYDAIPPNSFLDNFRKKNADLPELSFDDKIGDEILIHGIGNSFRFNNPLEISYELNTEISYYEHYGYDKENYERHYDFYDADTKEIDKIRILATPFDWSGLDEIPEEEIRTEYDDEIDRLKAIIAEGENNQVEFKPALMYNFTHEKKTESVKYEIARIICSFLNSNGGLLFIGLKDDGSIQEGLEKDFSLSNKPNSKDFFRLEIDSMIHFFLNFSIKPNLSGRFYDIDGKTIFVFGVYPLKTQPCFLNNHGEKEFWVRAFGGSHQIQRDDEIESYWENRQNTL